MNINKYTEKAQEALLSSQQLAEQSHHALVEPEHLLTTLVEQREGIVPEVLRKMSAEPREVALAARELLKKTSQAYGGAQPGLSPHLKIVTDLAEAEAARLKDEYVSTEHLLIGLAAEASRSRAGRLLVERGVTRDKILAALISIRGRWRQVSR
jgi:ATP-dependent Clp protease ATP-binding subunit ClpB